MAATHTATVVWTRGTDDFLDQRYHRSHQWRFDGGATVAASSSPLVVPLPYSDAAAVDPEEAYQAAEILPCVRTCSAAASAFFAAAFRMLEVSPQTRVFSAAKHGFMLLFPSHPPLQTDLPQAAQPREVVARHRQHKQLIHFLDPAHQHLAHVPHRLGPAKALFDQLSLSLRDGVAFAVCDPVRHRRLAP